MSELRTARLILRNVTPDDAAGVHAYAGDPEVCRFMVWGPNTPAESQRFVEEQLAVLADPARTSFNQLVTLAETGEVIGGIELRLLSEQHRRAEFGYVYRRDVWGQGYATEAARALVTWAFEHFGLNRIEATCDPENKASEAVLRKVGLQCEGLSRRHMKLRDGWRDSLQFAILSDDERP
ncbi:GNAT family N-acetyltransferase [Kineosporia succinea]|uniref:RimJ/RimL family protein N-acetyltransferase n=1 Tax=Kineosporia succinea TaxID=84632 RepID=A0ABT9P6Z3_9ACTN|nr:GNAT family N-acetyltransferase [Kineosporia succinea]MDP9828443.1 RimJ/RimL family protein N-acetyltransferase [Kineosporia succinea]